MGLGFVARRANHYTTDGKDFLLVNVVFCGADKENNVPGVNDLSTLWWWQLIGNKEACTTINELYIFLIVL